MELFGKEINVKHYNCSYFGAKPTKRELDQIALYVRFKGCNASCDFCEYMDDASQFDLKRYKEVLLYLRDKIFVSKINLTGGEPTLNWKLFNEVLETTREVFPDIYVVLNTNGFNFEKIIEEETYKKISNISLSRHHYDDKVNEEILRTKAPSTDNIKELRARVEEEGLHLTCNLIKGNIDSYEEAIKYLDWTAFLKIPTASFVSLMPINDFCKDSFVHFNELNLGDRLIMTQDWRYENMCHCNNWLYFPGNTDFYPIRVYTKNTFNPMDITTSLVYDGKHVKAGFNEEIVA
jgi:pyruvate-formate lyase-activating enzyme